MDQPTATLLNARSPLVEELKDRIEQIIVVAIKAKNDPVLIRLNGGLLDSDLSWLGEILKETVAGHPEIKFSLDLSQNNISDDGIDTLLSITNIQELNLSQNELTATGALKLMASPIQILDLSRNRAIKGEVEKFAKTTKQLKLSLDDTGFSIPERELILTSVAHNCQKLEALKKATDPTPVALASAEGLFKTKLNSPSHLCRANDQPTFTS
jgi:hypothetical protein